MIKPKHFVDALQENKIRFIYGVPDSLLSELCKEINARYNDDHAITSNEGCAVAEAIGRYLATEEISAVYMQNSGIGNTINPIISLADNRIYGIPIILIIGWRGEINSDGGQLKDEPQHQRQGEETLNMLKMLNINYKIIDNKTTNKYIFEIRI